MDHKNITLKFRSNLLIFFVFALFSISATAIPIQTEKDLILSKPLEDTASFFKTIKANKANKQILEASGNSQFVILDVRKPDDFLKGHINSAINIDFKSSDFSARLDSLNKTKTYFVICYGGVRSKSTMELMERQHFKKVYNIKGGMIKWRSKNLPVTK